MWWQRDVLVEVLRCLLALGYDEQAREARERLELLDEAILADLWGRPEESGPGLAVVR
jgi:hypothetical protein